MVLYETFTELQRARGRGPTSPDHLLKPGELPALFAEFEPIFYKEVTEPGEDALARLAARRRQQPFVVLSAAGKPFPARRRHAHRRRDSRSRR